MNNPEPNSTTPFPRPPAGNGFAAGQYPPVSAPPVSDPFAPPAFGPAPPFGPTQVSAPPAPQPGGNDVRSRGGRRPGVVLATAVAVFALLVATGALAVAWRSLDRAQDARDIALSGRTQPVPQPAAAEPTAPTAADPAPQPPPATDVPADPSGTGEPPPLNQRTVYKIKYEKQVLTLKAQGGSRMYADLDEPRANVDSVGSDLQLTSSGQTPELVLGEGVQGSDLGAPAMTPQDCADKIRTAPVGASAEIPVRQGLVLCVTTSFQGARARGDVQRMVLLEITGVGADKAVTVQATAWDIPR